MEIQNIIHRAQYYETPSLTFSTLGKLLILITTNNKTLLAVLNLIIIIFFFVARIIAATYKVTKHIERSKPHLEKQK